MADNETIKIALTALRDRVVKDIDQVIATLTVPAPTPAAQPTQDWNAQARVIEAAYKATGRWMTYAQAVAWQASQTVVTVTPPATPVPASPPATATTAADLARQTVANWHIGLNIERWRPVYMQYAGKPLTEPDYWEYLKTKRVDYLRFFFPYRPSLNMIGKGYTGNAIPTREDVRAMLRPIAAAAKAGIPSIFTACDVMGLEDFAYWDAVKKWLNIFAEELSDSNIPPNLLVPGLYNELAGGSNPDYNRYRLEAHDIFRVHLPDHTLSHGVAYWSHHRCLDDQWQRPSDLNIIVEFHQYEIGNAGHWSWVQGLADKFSTRHDGIPVINGEFGPGDFGTASTNHIGSVWVPNIRNGLSSLQRAKPCLWCVTDGGDFRLNRTDATLHGDIEAVLTGM
jgi:hypothetical protein